MVTEIEQELLLDAGRDHQSCKWNLFGQIEMFYILTGV
jgi:hypothetical protein